MLLTDAQKAVVHADMMSHPELAAMAAAGDDVGLANYYNSLVVPDFIVWKTTVYQDEITQSSTFDWTRVDNLTVGKARIWDMMFRNQSQSINPGNSNVRAGIDAAWVGTAADLAVRASVYAMCKRSATQLEKLLATGTGTTASPATLTAEGVIDYAEMSGVRVWQ